MGAAAAVERILVVGEQHVDVEEVAAVLVAADVAEVEDVLLDVVLVERLAELGAVAPADVGVAPVGGAGAGDADGEQDAGGDDGLLGKHD
ncbi:hypothetical protein SDC9_198965 [bioreactor metagenome]|uniref:Uncharacterized protein n=1 Tax=bioreactor metagenome TaxID=1076179 RepID=A0A645IKD5_9ZZZZ